MKIILPDQKIRILQTDPERIDRILHDLGISPHEVIISRNGTLIPDDTIVDGNDEIRIIRISHGG